MEGALKDSVPPYNEEAEMATLGALLLNFSVDLLEEVQQFVRAEDFFKGAHRLIFKAITVLKDKGEGVDLLTLTAELRASGNIDKTGGLGYVASLTERVPSTANVAYYAKLVQNASVRRSLLNIAYQLISDAHNESLESRLIIEEAEKSIFNLNDNQSRGELKSAQEVIGKTVSTIEDRFRTKGNYIGIPSGFDMLDRLTCGFQKSEMIIIGSRPSIGKTAFALSMATNISIRNKIPCGFFTLEMSAISLMLRIVSAESRINSNSLRTGLLKSTDFNKIVTDTAGRIYDAPLIFQDTPNIPLLDLRSLARKMVSKYSVQIIFIDYIGLVSPENTKQERHEQISQISRSLKALARELDVPIVVLSQVGRQSEGKTPSLADLRESGALEQDADVVLFLHRERSFDEDEVDRESKSIIKTDLIVAKQRNGPTDMVRLAFIPHYARFENLQDY
ncbi:Replicative DNA helicase (DnaB) [Olavius algarvensis spirochete endosymbiont]|uniref:replicative DNA helicase n=1 Tax=Olavius algarvensis spirochete endosymbiont TaxID=260710 RepID=UPI000B0FCD5B|nr:replicative DNA helicase [Olavius algarvensis spirochete endosymbiont]CAD7842481.1 MAG: Replicative DNA helicase (DnaB) (EC 3.6.4.12) [Olavius algarvensis spirochete endosymbiont]VDB00383.1 Replicative DNA helicase (DnaB) [Olavius algarvensis spirochete endosymbiont]